MGIRTGHRPGETDFFLYISLLFPAKPMGTMVSVQALTKGDVQEKISLSGPVSGTDAQQVTSGLHAKVTEILVKEGDKVEKGQVLARLDKTDVNTALEAAKTQLDLAKANKTEAEKNLVPSLANGWQVLVYLWSVGQCFSLRLYQ